MMALDNLRYGQFKPTAVAAEAKTLPGYGGQVEEWANYRFQVLAVEKKESMMTGKEEAGTVRSPPHREAGWSGPADCQRTWHREAFGADWSGCFDRSVGAGPDATEETDGCGDVPSWVGSRYAVTADPGTHVILCAEERGMVGTTPGA